MKQKTPTALVSSQGVNPVHPFFALLLLLLAVALIYSSLGIWSSQGGQGRYLSSNLNLQQVNEATAGGPVYTAIFVNNITQFSGQLRSAGYLSISVSSFNTSGTRYGSQYPLTISGTIIDTADSAAANAIMSSAVNASGTEPNPVQQGDVEYLYQYNGVQVPISTAWSSFTIREPSVQNQSAYPIYQYTSAFAYTNYAVTVTVTGYTSLEPSLSLSLAEAVFRNMIN